MKAICKFRWDFVRDGFLRGRVEWPRDLQPYLAICVGDIWRNWINEGLTGKTHFWVERTVSKICILIYLRTWAVICFFKVRNERTHFDWRHACCRSHKYQRTKNSLRLHQVRNTQATPSEVTLSRVTFRSGQVRFTQATLSQVRFTKVTSGLVQSVYLELGHTDQIRLSQVKSSQIKSN